MVRGGGEANDRVIQEVVRRLVEKLQPTSDCGFSTGDQSSSSLPSIPKYICIGPHHGTNSKLQRMGWKVTALRELLDRAKQLADLNLQLSEAAGGKPLQNSHYLAHLAGKVKELLDNNWNKEWYGIKGYKRDDANMATMVEMMLLDGCYLIAKFGMVGMLPQHQEGSDDGGQPNHQLGEELAAGRAPAITGQPPHQSPREAAAATGASSSTTSPAGSSPRDREQASARASSVVTEIGERQLQTTDSPASVRQPPRHSRVVSGGQQPTGGGPASTSDDHGQNNGSAAGTTMSLSQTVQNRTQRRRSLPRPPSSRDNVEEDRNWDSIVEDIWYLVENQMPLEVVERIYKVTTNYSSTKCREAFTTYAVDNLLTDYYFGGSNNVTPAGPVRGNGGSIFSTATAVRHWMLLQDCYRSVTAGTTSVVNRAPNGQGQEQEGQDQGQSQGQEQEGQGQELGQSQGQEQGQRQGQGQGQGQEQGQGQGQGQGQEQKGPYNLLDLLRSLLEPNLSSSHSSGRQPQGSGRHESSVCLWRPATDYVNNSNVWFLKQDLDGGARSVLDVPLAKGDEVRIPRLLINSDTCAILRNLLVLERQLQPAATYVTDYCLFMSQLACTAEDVRFLQSAGIIQLTIGDPSDVARDLRDMCRDIAYGTQANYLKPIWLHLEERYRNPWHKIGSWLRLNYCNGPGVLVLFFVSLAFLGTVLGAAFQIASYVLQKTTPSGH